MNFILQPMEKTDVEPLLPIVMEAFASTLEADGMLDMAEGASGKMMQADDLAQMAFAEDTDAYKVLEDGNLIGVAIVKHVAKEKRMQLLLLCIVPDVHGKGVGQEIMRRLEKRYPEAEVWETWTPVLAQRNIQFYVNKCGYHIVELIKNYQPESIPPSFEGEIDPLLSKMYRFEKRV